MGDFMKTQWGLETLNISKLLTGWAAVINLIIALQSHNNENNHLTQPREGPGLNVWESKYHYPLSTNKQLLLWKISSADNWDSLFVDWL